MIETGVLTTHSARALWRCPQWISRPQVVVVVVVVVVAAEVVVVVAESQSSQIKPALPHVHVYVAEDLKILHVHVHIQTFD